MFPDAITVPIMLTGATDMAQLRGKGVQAYGFGAIADEIRERRAGTDIAGVIALNTGMAGAAFSPA